MTTPELSKCPHPSLTEGIIGVCEECGFVGTIINHNPESPSGKEQSCDLLPSEPSVNSHTPQGSYSADGSVQTESPSGKGEVHDFHTNGMGLGVCRKCGTTQTIPQWPQGCTPKPNADQSGKGEIQKVIEDTENFWLNVQEHGLSWPENINAPIYLKIFSYIRSLESKVSKAKEYLENTPCNDDEYVEKTGLFLSSL